MSEKNFCNHCGCECIKNTTYCPKCGITFIEKTDIRLQTTANAHCASCGIKLGKIDLYCSNCGFENISYQVEMVKKKELLALSLPVTQKVDREEIKKVIKENAKEPSFWLSAGSFAGISLIVGLIISFILNIIISGEINNKIAEITNVNFFELPKFNLGTLAIWFFSCLGGFSFIGNITEFDINMKTSIGLVILLIIPIIALLAGRIARQYIMKNKYPERPISILESATGALLFALSNVMLNVFHNTTAENFIEVANFLDAHIDSAMFRISAISFNVFLVSFVIAIIFALPNMKEMLEQLKTNNSLLANSFAVAVSMLKRILIGGTIVVVVLLLVAVIKIISIVSSGDLTLFRDFQNVKELSVISIIIALPNLIIWMSSFLFGGSLFMNGFFEGEGFSKFLGKYKIGIGVAGTELSSNISQKIWQEHLKEPKISWFGWLWIIAGICLAISIFNKYLSEDDKESFSIKSIGICFASTVLFWAVSLGASFGGNGIIKKMGGMSKYTFTLTTASFSNFFFFLLISAIATGIIYLSNKNSIAEKIVQLFSSPFYVYLFIAVATIIAGLTINFKGMYW